MLREITKARMSVERVTHTLCVEREADTLAWRWNADRQAARQAALLHDVTKGLSEDDQLKLCGKYGIVVTSGESGKLLHALTGAAVARYDFGAPDEVVQAVRWHTTGRAGMSLLDKILFLADYVDSTRQFDGVRDLRKLCYENLDAALRMGLDFSIRLLLDEGKPICPATLEARNSLLP